MALIDSAEILKKFRKDNEISSITTLDKNTKNDIEMVDAFHLIKSELCLRLTICEHYHQDLRWSLNFRMKETQNENQKIIVDKKGLWDVMNSSKIEIDPRPDQKMIENDSKLKC